MITYLFTGSQIPDFFEQERIKNEFEQRLGPFKQEFEDKGGNVTFHCPLDGTKDEEVTFNFSNDYPTFDFVGRWNHWKRQQEDAK